MQFQESAQGKSFTGTPKFHMTLDVKQNISQYMATHQR